MGRTAPTDRVLAVLLCVLLVSSAVAAGAGPAADPGTGGSVAAEQSAAAVATTDNASTSGYVVKFESLVTTTGRDTDTQTKARAPGVLIENATVASNDSTSCCTNLTLDEGSTFVIRNRNTGSSVTVAPNESVNLSQRDRIKIEFLIYDGTGELVPPERQAIILPGADDIRFLNVSVTGDADTFETDERATYDLRFRQNGRSVDRTDPFRMIVGYRPDPVLRGTNGSVTVSFAPGEIPRDATGILDLQIGDDDPFALRQGPIDEEVTYDPASDRFTATFNASAIPISEDPIVIKSEFRDPPGISSNDFYIRADVEVNESEINRPPVPKASVEPNGSAAGTRVRFNGTGSFDDGSIAEYAWEFGDGSTATGRTADHVYGSQGTYTATLTVTDDEGLTNSTTVAVNVTSVDGPVARFDVAPDRPSATAPVRFNASDSVVDRPAAYEWAFGDGTNATGRAVAHTYESPGNYTVELTVTDAEGRTNTTTRTVTVAAAAPTATFSYGPRPVNATDTVRFDATNSTAPANVTAYEWTFGDGTNATGAVVNHTYRTPGNYTVNLTVTGASGRVNRTNRTVEVLPIDALIVDAGNETAPYERIQPAVDNASDGDRVLVRPGTYNDSAAGNVQVTVDRNVTIVAPDGATIAEEGRGVTTAFRIGADAAPTVRGFTVEGVPTPVRATATRGDWSVANVTVVGTPTAIEAFGSAGNWTARDVRLRPGGSFPGAVGINARQSTGSWRVVGSDLRGVGTGVGAADADSDWRIRGTILNRTTIGVDAGRTSGDWAVSDVRIERADTPVLAPNTTGDWRVAGSRVADAGRLVAAGSDGNWTVTDSTFVGTEGIGGERTAGAWTVRNVTLRNGSAAGIDARRASGEWAVIGTRVTRHDAGIRAGAGAGGVGRIVDATVREAGGPGIAAPDGDGRLRILNTTVVDGTGPGVDITARSAPSAGASGSSSDSGSSSGSGSATDRVVIRNATIERNGGAGVAASNLTASATFDGLRIRANGADGLDLSRTAGAWTVRNVTAFGNVESGINATRAAGAWTVRNGTVTGHPVGIRAAGTTGDWRIAHTALTANERGIGAAGTAGDWVVANTTVRERSAPGSATAVPVPAPGRVGVDAVGAAGGWTVRQSTLTGMDTALNATGTTGSWRVRRTNVTDNEVGITAFGASPQGNARTNWWGRAEGPAPAQCRGAVRCGDPLGERPTPDATGVTLRVFDGDTDTPATDVSVFLFDASSPRGGESGTNESTAAVRLDGRERYAGPLLGKALASATTGPAGRVRLTGLGARPADPDYCLLAVPPANSPRNVDAECVRVETGNVTERTVLLDDENFTPEYGVWSQRKGGPARRGYAPDGEAPTAPVGLRWSQASGTIGPRSLVVGGGHVYVVGAGSVEAYDASNGRSRWTFTGESDGGSPPSLAAAAYADDRLLVLGEERLYALDPGTGDVDWRTRVVDNGTEIEEFAASSQMVVADGSAYVTVATESGSDSEFNELQVTAVRTDGTVRWQKTREIVAGIGGAPAVSDGRLYVATGLGIATDALSPSPSLMGLKTGARSKIDPPAAGGAVPALADGRRYKLDGQRFADHAVIKPHLFAFDTTNGALRWQTGIPGSSVGPAVADGTVYLGTNAGSSADDGRVRAYDAADGTERERYTFDGPNVGIGGPPTVTENRLLVGNTSADAPFFDARVPAFNRGRGTFAWRARVNGGVVGSPIVVGDRAFAVTIREGAPRVYGLDAADGSVEWRFGEDVTLFKTFAPPAAADGVLYVVDNEGNLLAIHSARPESGVEVSKLGNAAEVDVAAAEPDERASAEVNVDVDGSVRIENASVTFDTTATDVRFGVDALSERPPGLPPAGGDSAGNTAYFQVEDSRVDDSSIAQATFELSLSTDRYDPTAPITVRRYHDGSWESLEATAVEEPPFGERVSVAVTTSGFSVFAVDGQRPESGDSSGSGGSGGSSGSSGSGGSGGNDGSSTDTVADGGSGVDDSSGSDADGTDTVGGSDDGATPSATREPTATLTQDPSDVSTATATVPRETGGVDLTTVLVVAAVVAALAVVLARRRWE